MATPKLPPIVPHLCVRGGNAAIAFYEAAFEAKPSMQTMAEDGVRLLHANLAVFGGQVMLHDEFPEYGGEVLSPHSRHGASVAISVNFKQPPEVDAIVDRAAAAGATVQMPAGDMFWGARYARILDPFGHVWAFNAPLPVPKAPRKKV